MKSPKLPRMPKVVETQDGIYIDRKFIPWVLLNNDGSSTTVVKPTCYGADVTISFSASSYTINKEHKRRYGYNFKHHCLFSKLNTIKRELNRIKGSLFSQKNTWTFYLFAVLKERPG